MLWILFSVGLVALAIFEGVKYGWFAASILIVFALLPDIALIGAFAEQPPLIRPERVRFYNLMHTPWIPSVMMLIALAPWPPLGLGLQGGLELFLAGLAWLTHICVDRALGYGLRNADGSIRPSGAAATVTWCRV